MLGCGKDKAVRLFKELDASGGIGLIERRKQGQGRPARIYVKNFTLPPDPEECTPSPGRYRRENRDRMEQMDAYRALIHENIDYGDLLRDHPYDADLIDGYVELMVEVCCTQREAVRVNQEDLPAAVVRSRFLKCGCRPGICPLGQHPFRPQLMHLGKL